MVGGVAQLRGVIMREGRRQGRRRRQRSRTFLHALHLSWFDEADAAVEHQPAENRKQQNSFSLLEAVRHDAPEGGAAELDEVANTDEQPAATGRQAELLVVDGQQRVQRAVGGIEEEVEDFGDEEVAVDAEAHPLAAVDGLRGRRLFGRGVGGGRRHLGLTRLPLHRQGVERLRQHVPPLLLLLVVCQDGNLIVSCHIWKIRK